MAKKLEIAFAIKPSAMIQQLDIKNYKSIKHLEMDCNRINVLIGEPNVGKSNILEALDLTCLSSYFSSNNNKSDNKKETINLKKYFSTLKLKLPHFLPKIMQL